MTLLSNVVGITQSILPIFIVVRENGKPFVSPMWYLLIPLAMDRTSFMPMLVDICGNTVETRVLSVLKSAFFLPSPLQDLLPCAAALSG